MNCRFPEESTLANFTFEENIPCHDQSVVDRLKQERPVLDIWRRPDGQYHIGHLLLPSYEKLIRWRGITHGSISFDRGTRQSWYHVNVPEQLLHRVVEVLCLEQSVTTEISTNRTLIDNELDGCNSLVGSRS